jgi:(p)ppGpp synthase/HD superfamily hydrolase
MLTERLERALRRASLWHQRQERRGSSVPYFEHVVAVAMILDRLRFDEDVVIAGLLHDAVEDTTATLAQIEAEFGSRVAELVGHCTEVKRDAAGRPRPWIDRKRDHLEALANAPLEARAILLADKLHNLLSIRIDLAEGRDVWSVFHAEKAQVFWYYHASLDTLGGRDERLAQLVSECRAILAELERER